MVNQGLTNDTDLIHVLLVWIIKIGNDDKGIFQAHLSYWAIKTHQIVIVVVRIFLPWSIQGTAKNGMGTMDSVVSNSLAEEKETLFTLCANPVKHNIEISRCWILNPVEKSAHCYKNTAWILYRTSSNSYIRNQIIHQREDFQDKDLISCCHSCLGNHTIV